MQECLCRGGSIRGTQSPGPSGLPIPFVPSGHFPLIRGIVPLSKGGVCYDRPGAFPEPQQPKFSTRPGPCGPEETDTGHSDFPRREGKNRPKETAPVNGGRGAQRLWTRDASMVATPSVFWFLFHVEKELAAPAAKSPRAKPYETARQGRRALPREETPKPPL